MSELNETYITKFLAEKMGWSIKKFNYHEWWVDADKKMVMTVASFDPIHRIEHAELLINAMNKRFAKDNFLMMDISIGKGWAEMSIQIRQGTTELRRNSLAEAISMTVYGTVKMYLEHLEQFPERKDWKLW